MTDDIENAKAAPITLYGRLLEERLQLREHIEALELEMSKAIYRELPWFTKVLMATQLAVMKSYMYLLTLRMKGL